jgi:hypothetical protein
MNKIFSLICEDAGSLGGPMAYATTEYRWTKLFSSKEKAKGCAEKYAKRPKDEIRWQGRGKEIIWDSGPYFFTIKEEKVL